MRTVIGLIVLAIFLVILTHGVILDPTAWPALAMQVLPFILVFVAIGTFFTLVQRKSEAKRDVGYEQFCAKRGFNYLAAPAGDQYGFDDFWLFQQGYARTLRHDIWARLAGIVSGRSSTRIRPAVAGRRGGIRTA